MFNTKNNPVKISEDELDERIRRAVSSIFENRLPIFLPIKKLHQTRVKKIFESNDNVIIFETEFGQIEVRNRLVTQKHKALLEAMLSYKKQLLTDNSFFVEFKVYDILKSKLKKKNATDYKTFKKYLKELKDIHILIKTNDNKEFGFGIIDDYLIDNNTGNYKVKFTSIFSWIWSNETLITYKKHTSVVNQIDNHLVQSIVRYMITFNQLQISVKSLAQNLLFDKIFSKKEFYNKLDEIRDSFSNEEYLKVYKKYGISFDKEFDNITIEREPETILLHKQGKTITEKLSKSVPQHNKSVPQHNSFTNILLIALLISY